MRRFATSGVLATLIHILAATLLINRLQVHPAAANSLSFVLANSASYLLNTYWTFQTTVTSRNSHRFGIVSITAWLATTAIAWGVERLGGHYLLGILIIVTTIPIGSYLAHRHYTYAPPDSPQCSVNLPAGPRHPSQERETPSPPQPSP